MKTERHFDGLWHVVGPDGLRTICGRPREPQRRGRPGRPTCGECAGRESAVPVVPVGVADPFSADPPVRADGRYEQLVSELGIDGEWHVRYPTATKTLCGLVAQPPRRGRRGLPTCGVCAKAARVFDRIDGSMPDAWRVAA